jgi:hypothetical protein
MAVNKNQGEKSISMGEFRQFMYEKIVPLEDLEDQYNDPLEQKA